MTQFKWFIFICAIFMLQCQSPVKESPLELDAGPHLFIDDYLIAEQSFLSRTVNNPEKYMEPIVTSGEDGDENFQPWLSVVRDPDTGLFRIWYNIPENIHQSHLGYMESEDGIHWIRPHRVLKDPCFINFCCSVIDHGPNYPDPIKRFVLATFSRPGIRIATSPDGLDWKALVDTAVIKHSHDIISLHWDSIRKRYLAIVGEKINWNDWRETRRIPYQSVSNDLLHWEQQWPILMPKIGAPIEQGETQFYGMSGIIARGDILIGLVKILRDDLNATPGKTAKEMGDMGRKAAGIGYTVLAWSRDGKTWQRDHEAFIPRNSLPGSWDHAIAWGADQLVVSDTTFLYYGGYARGHKVARLDDRHIGLARMPRDRYVSREADLNEGYLITKPLLLNAKSMTVNARVVGEMQLRLLDVHGKPLPKFGWVMIHGDSVTHPVNWQDSLESLAEQSIRIEFKLQYTQLFGFDLL